MLKIVNLKKKFGSKLVLNNINLEIKKGEIVGIIGPSGCGKSTLLRCINSLENVSSGKIIFDGKDLTKEKNHKLIGRKIGMVFQQFNLFDHMSVLENIIFAPVELKLMKKEEAIKKANELLSSIGLMKIANSYPNQISGGEKQRVAIIRTLIMKPDMILFDEPTSSLDPEMIGEVTNLMKKIASEGMTMIIVSHEMNFIRNFCTRVIFLDETSIKEDKECIEFFKNPTDKDLKTFLSKINDY